MKTPLFLSQFELFNKNLTELPDKKLLISTLNAYSYIIAQKDPEFAGALHGSDILLPDGISMVFAEYFLKREKIKKIAGADLFWYEINRLNQTRGTCFFLGSKEETLNLISGRLAKEYPEVTVHSFSPPFKTDFSEDDNRSMINAVNSVRPDVLFIGMTAPKQEKWAFRHFDELSAGHICCIGAVFDFYAGTVKRAPQWMIAPGLEWLYRLIKEPRRLWKRYLIGNTKFIWLVLKEKIGQRESR